MKKIIFIFGIVSATLLFWSCSENQSTSPEVDQDVTSLEKVKPAPNLIGEAVIDFTFTPPTFWNGTVDFGSYGVYGMTFISADGPRDYSQASPFYEEFIIYEVGNPTNIFIRGWNAGVVTYANKVPDPVNVVANGKITEAYGSLEMWGGCNFQSKGKVHFNDPHNGLPRVCLTTIRIN